MSIYMYVYICRNACMNQVSALDSPWKDGWIVYNHFGLGSPGSQAPLWNRKATRRLRSYRIVAITRIVPYRIV